MTQRELGWEQLWAHARSLGPDPAFADLDDRQVEVALHTRAVEASAALARLFEVLAEFVVRGIWADQGCRTPGAWLSWKLGIGASTGREWVRVAIRLRELPLIAERFAQGGLSYSKTRALTRIALPATQTWLLQWADHATAAELEHISRNLRGLQQARHTPADAADDDGWGIAVRSRPVGDVGPGGAWSGASGTRGDRGQPARHLGARPAHAGAAHTRRCPGRPRRRRRRRPVAGAGA